MENTDITINGPFKRGKHGYGIADLIATVSCGLHPTQASNARRIVACVNACEGINPEAVPELLEALKIAEDVITTYEVSTYGTITEDTKKIRRIIAKAEGKS